MKKNITLSNVAFAWTNGHFFKVFKLEHSSHINHSLLDATVTCLLHKSKLPKLCVISYVSDMLQLLVLTSPSAYSRLLSITNEPTNIGADAPTIRGGGSSLSWFRLVGTSLNFLRGVRQNLKLGEGSNCLGWF